MKPCIIFYILRFASVNKSENVAKACEMIRSAVEKNSPKLVALPECFNSPYGTNYFSEYAEAVPAGETSQILSNCALQWGIYIIGGSIPESEVDVNGITKLYNTCSIWSATGNLIGKHRKVHLFDVEVEAGITFKESDVLSPGDSFTVVEVDNTKIGIGICLDIGFEEMARVYRNRGCDMIIYPSAFELILGPLHWELLNGGKVIRSAKESEEIVVADLDLNIVDQVRAQIPVSFQRRNDLYETIEK